MTATMKAAVIYKAGGSEVLEIESRPIPSPKSGEVLIRIKAFGLNRSDLFTRQGHSPNVKFPRILGIEAVGLIEQAPGNEFRRGEIVATAMGGMGRAFDGSYAEYTCVPATQNPPDITSIKLSIPNPTSEMLPASAPATTATSPSKLFHAIVKYSNCFPRRATACRSSAICIIGA
jgi:NADPH:quinone reductase-like Zn-dependent oxidoreductase